MARKWEPVFLATNGKGVGGEIVLEQEVERELEDNIIPPSC